MTVWQNLWRHKTKLVTTIYVLVEVLRNSLGVMIDRTSYWYLALVIILIMLLLNTAYQAIAKKKPIT